MTKAEMFRLITACLDAAESAEGCSRQGHDLLAHAQQAAADRYYDASPEIGEQLLVHDEELLPGKPEVGI
ncbi:MAG TPA: hypothetical protein VJ770_22940 [Stellaceae bacterium]|nr:hypothetical protein [Stellaceae bacterium]